MPRLLCFIASLLAVSHLSAQQKTKFKLRCDAYYADSTGTRDNSVSWECDYIYPREALESGIDGVVTLSLDLTDTCKAENIKVLKGLGYGLDEAALGIAEKMAAEMVKNKDFCGCFRTIFKSPQTLPIRFRLK